MRYLRFDCKKKYGLENKFVVVFGGNIGLPQELEFLLLELAKEYKDRSELVFLIVGIGYMIMFISNPFILSSSGMLVLSITLYVAFKNVLIKYRI